MRVNYIYYSEPLGKRAALTVAVILCLSVALLFNIELACTDFR
jgi:hypothetical protein